MSNQRIGIYPGTFDPPTNGHLDIIGRAAGIVDRLIVGVAVNAGKGPLFPLDERVQMVREEVRAMGADAARKIEVKPFQTLLMHFAQANGANTIVRGLRAVSDFEYEFQMAAMNRRMDGSVETVFLMASETNQFISSRFVKEIARLGGDVTHFVSPRVAKRIEEVLRRGPVGPAEPAATTIPRPAQKVPL
jgi:pantetheine-phosphate adenylyltransferase